MNFRHRSKRLFSAFLEACTFDNWRHIVNATNCCVAFFWVLVQVVTIAATVYFVYDSVATYMQRATTTNVVVEVNRDDPVPFPQITFCRQNPYKTEELAKHLSLTAMLYKFIAKLYGDEQAEVNVRKILSQQYSGSTLDCIMKQMPSGAPDVDQCSSDATVVSATPQAQRAKRAILGVTHLLTTVSSKSPISSISIPDEIIVDCNAEIENVSIPLFCGVDHCDSAATPDTLSTHCPEEPPPPPPPPPAVMDPPAPKSHRSDQLQITTEAEASMAYALAQLSDDIIRNMSYKLEEMLKACKFNSKPCDTDREFADFVSFAMGICYMYNTAGKGRDEPRNATRAGALGGLTLTFRLEIASALKILAKDGVKLLVTTPGSVVLPQSSGFIVAPGYSYHIAVNLVKITRIRYSGHCFPPRFVTETDTDLTYYYYDRTYGVVGCLASCQQKLINETCGCADPNVEAKSSDMTYCTGENKSCVDMAYDDPSLRRQCDTACMPECDESTYTITQSVVKYPAEGYVPMECVTANGTNDSCVAEYSQKVAVTNIYFPQLTYEKIEEQWAYDSMRMFTDITNTIGLYIGIGVISAIELLILPLLCLCACFPTFMIDEDEKVK